MYRWIGMMGLMLGGCSSSEKPELIGDWGGKCVFDAFELDVSLSIQTDVVELYPDTYAEYSYRQLDGSAEVLLRFTDGSDAEPIAFTGQAAGQRANDGLIDLELDVVAEDGTNGAISLRLEEKDDQLDGQCQSGSEQSPVTLTRS